MNLVRLVPLGALALVMFSTGRARAQSAEPDLAHEARLSAIIGAVLAHNPELQEAKARSKAAKENASAVSRLPDPEFKYELWGGQLKRPFAFDEAQMHMFGLRQSIPAPGSLGAESRARSEQTAASEQMQRARAQELVARVKRAYAEYYRADREYRVYAEHLAFTQQFAELSAAMYRAGRGTQQDVLRSSVELSRLKAQLATLETQRSTARALLNTLMARAPDAPLGPPAELATVRPALRDGDLQRRALARPEVVAAEHGARGRQDEVEGARAVGRWPSFMVGVDYQYMPTMDDPHGYGVMFTMSLPWLNPKYGEQVRAAQASLEAEQSALRSARDVARYEAYTAALAARAASERLELLDQEVLPRAQQSFEAAQAAYRAGQGDALGLLDAHRSLLDARVERERAVAELSAATADVERAVGAPVEALSREGGVK